MDEESYYFPHNYGARENEKLVKLRRIAGWQGYGLYWAIVEKLYESGGYLDRDYDSISFSLLTDTELIKTIVEDFKLFTLAEKKFTNDRVLQNINRIREKRAKAQKSAKVRWKKSDANAMRPHSERNATASANAMLIKERKGKENKVKESIFINLKDLIEPVIGQYAPSITESFLAYWTEKNPNGQKERWQMEKIFDPVKRLNTWQRNQEKWDAQKIQPLKPIEENPGRFRPRVEGVATGLSKITF